MATNWIASLLCPTILLASPLYVSSLYGQTDSADRHKVAAALTSHQYREAILLLQPMLDKSPRDASLWTLQGLALDGEGHTKESLDSFDRALSLDATFKPAMEGAAQTAYRHGDPQALQYVKKLLAIEPENRTANAMAGAIAYQSRDCATSATYFRRSQTEVYRDRKALEEFADCLLKQQQADEAIELLARGVQIYPASVELKYNLAVAYLHNHQPDEVITLLSPLTSEKDSDLLNLLASAYTQAKRPDDAFRVLESAIEISPKDQTNYLDLAILCLEHNQETKSMDAASAGIARIPNAVSLYLIRGIAHAQLAQYDKAESDFTAAAQIDPDQPHSTIAMSLLYSDQNQVDKEKELLIKQLKITPKDAVTNYLLADLLIRGGTEPGQPTFQEAQAHLATSLQSKPDSAEAQILMGKLLEQQNRLPEALDHFDAALRSEPENRNALNRKFVLLRKLHRNDEATEVLTRLKTLLNNQLNRETSATQVRVDAQSNN